MRDLSFDDVVWASVSVQRQNDSPLAVGWLCKAILAMREMDRQYEKEGLISQPTVEQIIELARVVKPEVHDVRNIPVRFANFNVNSNIGDVIRYQLTALTRLWRMISAEEMYQEFQQIHPFTDGNGRVGALLYNWHRGTFYTLQHPPEFKQFS